MESNFAIESVANFIRSKNFSRVASQVTNMKMTSTNMRYEVEPFDGKSNFSIWQCTVKDVLAQQGLAKALEGKKPSTMTDEKWTELEAKAVATIRLSLAPQIKYQVLTETSSKDLWEKLEKVYKSKSLSNRLYLKKELYRFRMEEGSDLTNHINEFNRLVTQLTSIDVKLDEEDKALLLLVSLPDSYSTLQTTLLVGKEKLAVDDVMSAVLDQDKFGGNTSRDQGDSLLAFSDGRGRGPNRKKNSDKERGRSQSRPVKTDKSQVECYRCYEKGHFKNQCPLLKKENKKKGKQIENSANVAEQADRCVQRRRAVRSDRK